MFCKNCGNEIKDNAKFCSSCGTCTETPSAPVQTPPSAPAPAPTQPSAANNNIAIVGFSLSMAAVLFWFLAIFIMGLPFTIISLGLSVAGIACSARGIGLAASVGNKNKGLAIAGLTVGIVSAVIAFILMILAINMLANIYSYY